MGAHAETGALIVVSALGQTRRGARPSLQPRQPVAGTQATGDGESGVTSRFESGWVRADTVVPAGSAPGEGGRRRDWDWGRDWDWDWVGTGAGTWAGTGMLDNAGYGGRRGAWRAHCAAGSGARWDAMRAAVRGNAMPLGPTRAAVRRVGMRVEDAIWGGRPDHNGMKARDIQGS